MHSDLIEMGWTEEQWNRICSVVTEEAQRARVGAQFLPVTGPEHPSTVAIPKFGLSTSDSIPYPYPAGNTDSKRLAIDSDPNLPITCIAINIELRTHEAADPELSAAQVMFRRAANTIARVEDALIFNGRAEGSRYPNFVGRLPHIYSITDKHSTIGLLSDVLMTSSIVIPSRTTPNRGNGIISGIIKAITTLEGQAQTGPFACILAQDAFEAICDPAVGSLVMPRDRILPFLQGPLLRSNAIRPQNGVVVALGGNPVELVVASDIRVKYLQTTLEPRYVFRVSERIALRIKDKDAVVPLSP